MMINTKQLSCGFMPHATPSHSLDVLLCDEVAIMLTPVETQNPYSRRTLMLPDAAYGARVAGSVDHN